MPKYKDKSKDEGLEIGHKARDIFEHEISF